MAMALGRLWNWLYDGVEFEHVENLSGSATARKSSTFPAIAATWLSVALPTSLPPKELRSAASSPEAKTLDLPVIGRFLRKGGAFSCAAASGDALYPVVLPNIPRS